MARAAVKAKQQARAKAQPQQHALKRRHGRRRGASGGNPNQDLFFMRLRRHAKWAYVALAVLFAVTFVGLGVGSGSSGLSQVFSGLDIFGGGSGTSLSKALKEVDAHPKSPKSYRDLATAYEQKGDTGGAITALQSYTMLARHNAAAWAELGGLQLTLAQRYATQYQEAATAQQAAAPSQTFLPAGALGTAIGADPIESASAAQAGGRTNDLYYKATSAYQQALSSYQTVARLHPNDPNAQFEVAAAAQSAGQYDVAVTALKRYLKLNPATTDRAQIERLIKQLSPAPAKQSQQSSSGGK